MDCCRATFTAVAVGKERGGTLAGLFGKYCLRSMQKFALLGRICIPKHKYSELLPLPELFVYAAESGLGNRYSSLEIQKE